MEKGVIRIFYAVIIVAFIVLIYAGYNIFALDNGGMAGYITQDDRVFTVDYTDCTSDIVTITIRNLDGEILRSPSELQIIRLNDGERLSWDADIRPDDTAVFTDGGCEEKGSLTCRYEFHITKYGIKRTISVACPKG